MFFEEGVSILMEGVSYFHKNYKNIYGQMALRFDDETYLMTGGNKLLCEIKDSDIEMCNIKTGDLGKLFTDKPDFNVFIFGCTQSSVEASKDNEFLPVALDDMAHLAGSKVKIVDNANPETLLEAFSDTNVCLVRGAGFTVVSDSIWQAAASAQVVEKSCEAFVHGKLIGGIVPIAPSISDLLRRNFTESYINANKNSTADYISFNEESYDLRNSLKNTCNALIQNELVYGSWGNASVRLDDENFLITPTAVNTLDMKPEEFPMLKTSSLESNNHMKPSGSAYIHARMYKDIRDCNAIIHTHSNACSIFAACAAGFAINAPTMRQLIGDVKLIPFVPESKKIMADKTVSIMQDTHAAIMANQGAIFYGPSLDVVLEIAESVETLACKLLNLFN